MLKRSAKVLAVLAVACMGAGGVFAASGDTGQLEQTFLNPPANARPMVRWWWFGAAITKEGIDRELTAMKEGGFGGFELQQTYPLALDGGTGADEVKNLQFMSPELLNMIGYAATKAKELGLRMDLTLGSGWPYGGPQFSAGEGAGRIETEVSQVKAGTKSVPFPTLRPGRMVVAAFAGPAIAGGGGTGGARGGRRGGGGGEGADVSGLKPVPINNDAAELPEGFSSGEVVFFISGRTGMQVKRPAFGAEGNVIDHLSATVVDKFINQIAEPEIKACGPNAPYAVFCDSLEVQGENWTDDFLAEFQKRRGYDLKPFLPALMGNIGPETEKVRYDFGRTNTELYNEHFNAKFKALAAKYGSKFRVQDYGSPAAGLLSYAYADLPEGEGGGNGLWRTFRTTRYASSASHLMGVPVTSSETFTWLHTAPFRATPLDVKGEVDTHFLDGINQVICHGWPYTGNGAKYPGWSFYAAAVVDDKNPWYVGMPDVSAYIQRMSAVLREGTPANDVAIYLPDSDVWSQADMRFSSLNAAHTGDAPLLTEILGAGYNVDGWDDGMLAMKGKEEGGTLSFTNTKYGIVVLSAIKYMPLETARALDAFSKDGGVVIAMGVPTLVPGLKATEADQAELAAITKRIFSAEGKGIVVKSEEELGAALKKTRTPDVAFEPASPLIGAVHRHTNGGEVYFVANTDNKKTSVQATFRETGMQPELWNGLTGKITPLAVTAKGDGTETVALDLDAYGSALVVFTNRTLPAATVATASASPMDLSTGWNVTFADGPGGKGGTVQMDKLQSWTELPDMKNYSGVATYEKKITVSAEAAKAGMAISFGEGKAIAPGGGRGGNGFVAQMVGPVADVAVVYVNDKRAGDAWCPPYQVDVTGLLKEGDNTIRIVVGNTAVNYLQKAGFPNYDLQGIRGVYGSRFDPQGTQLYAQPLPSGLMGPITLGPSAAK